MINDKYNTILLTIYCLLEKLLNILYIILINYSTQIYWFYPRNNNNNNMGNLSSAVYLPNVFFIIFNTRINWLT